MARVPFAGAMGLCASLNFLHPSSVSLLTQHRRVPPYGMAGGQPGATGRQIRIRADGDESELPGITGFEASSGERLRIETPGGGGWGAFLWIQPPFQMRMRKEAQQNEGSF